MAMIYVTLALFVECWDLRGRESASYVPTVVNRRMFGSHMTSNNKHTYRIQRITKKLDLFPTTTMASSSVSEAQIRSEIARLTGRFRFVCGNPSFLIWSSATIKERKSKISEQNSGYPRINSRNNTYINPNYRPANKYIRPDNNIVQHQLPLSEFQSQVKPPSTQVKDVVINGVAFESSRRSLVRKDCEYLWPLRSLKGTMSFFSTQT